MWSTHSKSNSAMPSGSQSQLSFSIVQSESLRAIPKQTMAVGAVEHGASFEDLGVVLRVHISSLGCEKVGAAKTLQSEVELKEARAICNNLYHL